MDGGDRRGFPVHRSRAGDAEPGEAHVLHGPTDGADVFTLLGIFQNDDDVIQRFHGGHCLP